MYNLNKITWEDQIENFIDFSITVGYSTEECWGGF